jgi:hypothetical protein
MKKFRFSLFIAAFLLLNISCKHVTDEDDSVTEIIRPYFNSFESDADTTGWRGNGFFDLRDNGAPDGGSRSLFVTGGCPVPHAFFDLGVAGEKCSLKVRCWGKNLDIGGSVSLEWAEDASNNISVAITDTGWTYYESADVLFFPSDKTVRICLNSGSIAASSMLVDLLEIVRIK